MNRPAALKWLALGFVGGLTFACLRPWSFWTSPAQAAQGKAEKASPAWIQGTADERWGQAEKHFRGLDVAMMEVGHRYGELLLAAKAKNWEYAKYQAEKLEFTIRLAVERRPKRAKSAEPFFKEAIPPLLSALDAKNAKDVTTSLARLHYHCQLCHGAEKVLYFNDVVDRIKNRFQ